jgi:hypothetical protein
VSKVASLHDGRGSSQAATTPAQIVFNLRQHALHRVKDGETGRDAPAGRIDVERNVPIGVLVGKVQELSHQHVRHLVVHVRAQEQDPVLEESGDDVELAGLAVHGRERGRPGRSGRRPRGLVGLGLRAASVQGRVNRK